MIHESFARYPLFRLLDRQEFNDWLALGSEIGCDSGVTIFQENTLGAWVYLVLAGRVRILRETGSKELTLGMLQTGDVFGEYALLRPYLNTANCRTAMPSRLFRLPLEPLRTALRARVPVWSNLKSWLRLHTLLHFHRDRAFLGFMSADSALKLLNRLKPASFPAGQTIQADGLAVEHWHLIEHGQVHLGAADPSEPAEGKVRGTGEAFGERALLGAGGLATATARTDVRCLVLTRSDFDPSAPLTSQIAQSYVPLGPAGPIWVPQLGPADCGLAALAMVAQGFGLETSVEQLRTKSPPGPEGLTLQQLQDLAEEIGLACRGARLSLDRLGQVTFPAIAHLREGHYIVLHQMSEAGVTVGDPATGTETWSLASLAASYAGSLLLFHRPEV